MRSPFLRKFWQHRYLLALVLMLGAVIRVNAGPDLTDLARLAWPILVLFYFNLLTCVDFWDRSYTDIIPLTPGASPLAFELNLGQVDQSFDFVADGGPVRFLLSSEGLSIRGRGPLVRALYSGTSRPIAEPLDANPGRVHYLLGNRPERWITDVPTYDRVRYRDVYPGIDVVYYGRGRELEHDFVVRPGADPNGIQIRFTGLESLTLDSEGTLRLFAESGPLILKKPDIYQEDPDGRRRRVEGRYRLNRDKSVGFEVGVFDRSRALVIDPVISFSTYYGRGTGDVATRMVVDPNGNILFTGTSADSSYPRTGGALEGSIFSGAMDVIVTKLSADGRTPVYTTHFGGSDVEVGGGIALDAAGNIYLAGVTFSLDFPVTRQIQNPAPTLEADTGNCYVSKLNAAGNALVYSTLLGGSGSDACSSIAVDASGSALVAGATLSRDFPTRNAAQSVSRIGVAPTAIADAFVSKLSSDGASFVYSTLVGGTGNDGIASIAVDAAGNAYVTGATISTDFPVTAGAFQTRFGGVTTGNLLDVFSTGDAFATKLSPTGTVVYSTFLGGSRDEVGFGIVVDAQGNAYIAGNTQSSNFPTAAAAQGAYAGAGGESRLLAGDAFVTKLNPQGTALVYSTYLGGRLDDRATAIALDAQGNVHITGNTLSTNFPLTADATDRTFHGQREDGLRPANIQTGDAFYAQFGPAGNLVFSTYAGGFAADFGAAVASDNRGGAVIAGGTNSPDFLTTASSAQTSYGGASPAFRPMGDAFVVRYASTTAPSLSISSVENAASYASAAVAPGEIVIVKGVGIGPADLTTAQLDAGGGIAKVLAETRVLFDDVPAPLVYVSARQVGAIVPYGVASRAATSVVVEYKGVRSFPVSVPVTAVVPALFSADASGRGQGAILNQNGTYNSASNPAEKGSVIQLFGTGEGATNPAGVDGRVSAPVVPRPVLPVSVSIGGRTAQVTYAGSAPGAVAGLLQVNAVVPEEVASGSVAVQIQVGTVASQTGLTLAVR